MTFLSLAPGLEISPQITDMAGVCAPAALKAPSNHAFDWPEPTLLSGRNGREVSRNVSLHFLLDFHDEKVQLCFEKG
jgi:hypothetical protein